MFKQRSQHPHLETGNEETTTPRSAQHQPIIVISCHVTLPHQHSSASSIALHRTESHSSPTGGYDTLAGSAGRTSKLDQICYNTQPHLGCRRLARSQHKRRRWAARRQNPQQRQPCWVTQVEGKQQAGRGWQASKPATQPLEGSQGTAGNQMCGESSSGATCKQSKPSQAFATGHASMPITHTHKSALPIWSLHFFL